MEEILHHLGCIKPYEYWDIYYIKWCRMSSINSISWFPESSTHILRKILELPRWWLPWKSFWPLMGWSLAGSPRKAIEKDGDLWKVRCFFSTTDAHDVIIIYIYICILYTWHKYIFVYIINICNYKLYIYLWCGHMAVLFCNSTCFSSVTGSLEEIEPG